MLLFLGQLQALPPQGKSEGALARSFAFLFESFSTPALLEQGDVHQPCAGGKTPRQKAPAGLLKALGQKYTYSYNYDWAVNSRDSLPAPRLARKPSCSVPGLLPKFQSNRRVPAQEPRVSQAGLGAMPRALQRPCATFRVEVVVGSTRLLVPCGQGDRTVAWLLQQVQNRWSSSHQVCGAEHILRSWLLAVKWMPLPAKRVLIGWQEHREDAQLIALVTASGTLNLAPAWHNSTVGWFGAAVGRLSARAREQARSCMAQTLLRTWWTAARRSRRSQRRSKPSGARQTLRPAGPRPPHRSCPRHRPAPQRLRRQRAHAQAAAPTSPAAGQAGAAGALEKRRRACAFWRSASCGEALRLQPARSAAPAA